MAKTLGLDLGTNSIGWAIIENGKNEYNKNTTSLLDKGVLIFSEGVKNEKGQESSRAAERTEFRSSRKLNFRRKLRKYETLLVLAKNEMCPLTIEDVRSWRKSNFKKYPTNPDFLNWLKTDDEKSINPYLFRDKASKEKINKLSLGRAFYHIAQRRGFLSNRLDASDNSIIEEKMYEIEQVIEESNTAVELQKYLDEYFNDFDKKNETEKPLFKLSRAFYGIIKNSDDDITG
ncbi:MAG: type II CRISPR RNA-guided endonuclease Cas9, partial [Candidatus Marinimicrobia bacterium]|nr:type II CRISPR RNA-guided endonuclease Cas9 [Candidatus Neomarinimicrobiota bacterium]